MEKNDDQQEKLQQLVNHSLTLGQLLAVIDHSVNMNKLYIPYGQAVDLINAVDKMKREANSTFELVFNHFLIGNHMVGNALPLDNPKHPELPINDKSEPADADDTDDTDDQIQDDDAEDLPIQNNDNPSDNNDNNLDEDDNNESDNSEDINSDTTNDSNDYDSNDEDDESNYDEDESDNDDSEDDDSDFDEDESDNDDSEDDDSDFEDDESLNDAEQNDDALEDEDIANENPFSDDYDENQVNQTLMDSDARKSAAISSDAQVATNNLSNFDFSSTSIGNPSLQSNTDAQSDNSQSTQPTEPQSSQTQEPQSVQSLNSSMASTNGSSQDPQSSNETPTEKKPDPKTQALLQEAKGDDTSLFNGNDEDDDYTGDDDE